MKKLTFSVVLALFVGIVAGGTVWAEEPDGQGEKGRSLATGGSQKDPVEDYWWKEKKEVFEKAMGRYGRWPVREVIATFKMKIAAFQLGFLMHVADKYGMPIDVQRTILRQLVANCKNCGLFLNNPEKILKQGGCVGIRCGFIDREVQRYKDSLAAGEESAGGTSGKGTGTSLPALPARAKPFSAVAMQDSENEMTFEEFKAKLQEVLLAYEKAVLGLARTEAENQEALAVALIAETDGRVDAIATELREKVGPSMGISPDHVSQKEMKSRIWEYIVTGKSKYFQGAWKDYLDNALAERGLPVPGQAAITIEVRGGWERMGALVLSRDVQPVPDPTFDNPPVIVPRWKVSLLNLWFRVRNVWRAINDWWRGYPVPLESKSVRKPGETKAKPGAGFLDRLAEVERKTAGGKKPVSKK